MKKFCALFLFLGLLILCGALYQAKAEYHFTQNVQRTSGHVIGLGLDSSEGRSIWYPVIHFNDARGSDHEFVASVGSTGYRSLLGQEIDVLYLPDNPKEARITGFEGQYLGALVAAIFGIAFLLVGALPLMLLYRPQSFQERLLQEGLPIQVTLIGVVLNSSAEMNGHSPWRIVCQWVDRETNKLYLFHSENINYDPTPWLKKRRQTIVYLDRENINQYYVDISWLPEQ